MECSSYLVNILFIINNILKLVQVIAPILLIISLVILITKKVVSPDDKKTMKKIMNSVFALIILFFVPLIVNVFIGMVMDNYNLYRCLDVNKNSSVTTFYNSNKKKNKITIDSNKFENGESRVEKNSVGELKIDTNYQKEMINRANRIGSETDYFIVVDVNNFRVTVLHKVNNNWKINACFNASMGYITNGRSHTGLFENAGNERIWKVLGHDPDYPDASNFTYYVCGEGNDCQGFHNLYEICKNDYCSHGCVRMTDSASKYIYDTIPVNTTVNIFQDHNVN